MLSRTLRGLERDGLIHGKMLTAHSSAVSYSLSELGRSLDDVIPLRRDWAERNIDEMHHARPRFDETAGSEDRTPWQH